jgi:hypothetical protein
MALMTEDAGKIKLNFVHRDRDGFTVLVVEREGPGHIVVDNVIMACPIFASTATAIDRGIATTTTLERQ